MGEYETSVDPQETVDKVRAKVEGDKKISLGDVYHLGVAIRTMAITGHPDLSDGEENPILVIPPTRTGVRGHEALEIGHTSNKNGRGGTLSLEWQGPERHDRTEWWVIQHSVSPRGRNRFTVWWSGRMGIGDSKFLKTYSGPDENAPIPAQLSATSKKEFAQTMLTRFTIALEEEAQSDAA